MGILHCDGVFLVLVPPENQEVHATVLVSEYRGRESTKGIERCDYNHIIGLGIDERLIDFLEHIRKVKGRKRALCEEDHLSEAICIGVIECRFIQNEDFGHILTGFGLRVPRAFLVPRDKVE